MSRAYELEAAAKFPMNTTNGRDYKAWAKRILHRDERGDKTLLSIQVKFARTAMGLDADQQTGATA
ncbi:hypothetical protein INH39_25480 [Massilia violaceinigra]|uniref:AntA/AntB antirepressor domain-containing protein n=1 Tax=Massilia violaceinigra TaxID=2045208 RepID=A0ABY4A807_9BURK|nr:hypothetical protein [Massilia violaceinigra]UOD28763.1 hypothetical protein INH39_25480 [Massilia violaceinigra]